MARRIHLQPHFTTNELATRYRSVSDPIERSRWQFLWLLSRGFTATTIATMTGYSAYWIGQIARRYNAQGVDGVRDRRHHSRTGSRLLSEERCEELRAALLEPAPGGDRWCGRTVAAWISQRLGRRVPRQVGWRWLRRIGAHWRKPRPRHISADPVAQRDFKQDIRPLLRQVATAFPHSRVELWAVDEHRIGLKPLVHKIWTLDKQRPIAPVEHRFVWRYLVGFVHPGSGRTIFHLATSVNLALFETELEAFAAQVGASPGKQIVLILDRAGWHASVRLRVPEHIHLLFLPAYSPELQPAEHLWSLTNTALANQHFTSIEGVENAQAARCVVLQGQPDLVRSATCFAWWPRRLMRRRGPRQGQLYTSTAIGDTA
jgi:transposase